jgi:hypothetical protein
MKFRFVFALMMEAARTSETSVDNYFTGQYIPEDKSELHFNIILPSDKKVNYGTTFFVRLSVK